MSDRLLFLARHGETDWNRERRIQGWTDVPLNAEGFRQAQALAETLRPLRPRRVFVSDLQRSRQTGEVVSQILGLPLVIDHRLREVHRGELDGYLVDIARVQFPEFFQEWERRPYDARPPGGESARDAEGRVRQFLQDWWPCLDHAVIIGHRLLNLVFHHLLVEPVDQPQVFFAQRMNNGEVRTLRLPPAPPS